MTEAEPQELSSASQRWFGRPASELDVKKRQALERHLARKPVSTDVNERFDDGMTFGQRLADRVAEFGGSWAFIVAFGVFLGAWVLLNTVLALFHEAFDPYPFIFLNLLLSMVAAMQAPVIMMSQNRQSAKDRLDAAHDYEVNLKSEIEIMALHDKLDQIRTNQLEALIGKQQEQIDLLTRMLDKR